MKLIQCAALFAIAMPAFLTVSLRADCIPVKVVVITTFQSGKDNDATGGEFGNWVLNLPLSVTIPFPQGYHHLRYNPELQVLGIVTGQGKSHAAASIMGLGMDPRFDLSKAYWIIAAIAGLSYPIAHGYKEVTVSNGEALLKAPLDFGDLVIC